MQEACLQTFTGLDGRPQDELKVFTDKFKEWGVSLVGIGDVSTALVPEFRHLPRAVSLAVHHPVVEPHSAPESGKAVLEGKEIYSHQLNTVDTSIESIQKRAVAWLQSKGWRAFRIPPDSNRKDPRFVARLYPLFPHKTAATCAGLGWVGKSGLLITPQFGPRASWGTILTDAPLKVAENPFVEGRCGKCRRCVETCPAGAIPDSEWVMGTATQSHIDREACGRHIEENSRKYGVWACGLCLSVCPQGRRVHG